MRRDVNSNFGGQDQEGNSTKIMNTKLNATQIYDGYVKSLDNATRLFSAGQDNLKKYPELSLGLFEFGQEEVGKSFSFLAAFYKLNNNLQWKSFWEDWFNEIIEEFYSGKCYYTKEEMENRNSKNYIKE